MTETLDRPATLPARQNGAGHQAGQTALATMAQRYQISQEGLADIIKKRCITGNASDAEFKAFVVVANQYGLNPLMKEIHAFADPHRGIVPIVGIDGWSRIVNSHPEFDGCEFDEAEAADGKPIKTTCVMHVKGRGHPVRVTERFAECVRKTAPWTQMPFRMLRHKAYMQAARLAFSLGGIYDEDEARDIIGQVVAQPTERGTAALVKKLTSRPVSEGQEFVPDPVAAEQVAAETPERQLEAHDFSVTPEEKAALNEPVEPAAPVPTPPDPKAEWKEFALLCEQEAQKAGIDVEQFDRGMKKFIVGCGAKGKEHTIPADKRDLLLKSIREKEGYFRT